MLGRRPLTAVVKEAGGVGIIQPDLSHCGGLTEVKKIAAMAEAYDVALAPHCPLGPIALAACLLAVCSCVKEQLPTGGFGRGSIVPVVSSADVQTKSDAPESGDGRCIAAYPVEVFGKDTLRLYVYEYDNNDLPAGMQEEEVPTKGEVVTSTSINAAGQQFRMDAWLESVNRYDGSQDGDDNKVNIKFHHALSALFLNNNKLRIIN